MRIVRSVLLVLLVAGCDADKDGLSGGKEKDLGTDPKVADSDGDGLSDGDEVTRGTDPLAIDSDGDGYRDPDEIAEGVDPLDPDDGIYEGGWPYYPEKDAIEDPGWDDEADEGELIPRFAWVDQFGQDVDIYDFAYQGKPILLEISEINCYWCEELAKLLEHRNSALDGFGYEHIADLVDDGTILWVTALDGNFANGRSDPEIVEDWYDRYPHEKIPVLYDEDRELLDWMGGLGWPTITLVEEDMTAGVVDRDYPAILDEILERYPE